MIFPVFFCVFNSIKNILPILQGREAYKLKFPRVPVVDQHLPLSLCQEQVF